MVEVARGPPLQAVPSSDLEWMRISNSVAREEHPTRAAPWQPICLNLRAPAAPDCLRASVPWVVFFWAAPVCLSASLVPLSPDQRTQAASYPHADKIRAAWALGEIWLSSPVVTVFVLPPPILRNVLIARTWRTFLACRDAPIVSQMVNNSAAQEVPD